jgi:hypothetical protein
MAVVISTEIIPYFSFFKNVKALEVALQEDLKSIMPAENGSVKIQLRYPERLPQTEESTITVSFIWPYSKPVAGYVAATLMGRLCLFANIEPAMSKCGEIRISAESCSGTESLTEKRGPNGQFKFFEK